MAKYFIRKCTAAITAAFLLSAMSTIDRHDEHLNTQVEVKYQQQDKAAQEYANGAYEAMWAERNKGNYMEVLEP